MQPVFNRSLTITMGVVVALLIVNGGLTYLNTRQLREDAAWVSHSHEVLDAVDLLTATLRDASAGERGYLLTDHPRFSDRFNEAQSGIHETLDHLRTLTGDNSEQRNRILAMQERILANLDKMSANIAMQKKDPAAAKQMFMARAAVNPMDSIRNQVEEIKQTEQKLLFERERHSLHSYRIAIFAGLVTPLLGLAMIAAFIFLLHRYIDERNRADQLIREQAETVNRQVEERTAELATTYRELEAFSYTISHDLRAPLRHIASFVELLGESSADRLDEQGHRYMRNISAAAVRMGRLIDDLLMFSRIGRATMSDHPVDLGKLVEEVRAELSTETQGRNIEWQIGPLPEVTGDPVLLRTVVANLLSNAIKYTRQRNPARIQVGSELRPTEVVCFVRDNGAGFDMRFVDKLFGVFERLHRLEDFEGTGIGLASVRRIINRHGGSAWAEGEIDRGATFYFSLPTGKTK